MTTGLLNATQLTVLLLVALIILGPNRLPHAGRALGRGMREFRNGITGRDDTILETEAETPTPTSTTQAATAPGGSASPRATGRRSGR